MIPARVVLVLLPLLALLGSPIMSQVEVCRGHAEHGPVVPPTSVHWAGDCGCEIELAIVDDAEVTAGDRVACDCDDAPLADADPIAMPGQPPTLLPSVAAPTIVALAYPSQPRSTAKAPRQARPPPPRALGLTHLASVRLLI